MNRRQVLHALAVGGLLSTGCLSRTVPGESPTTEPSTRSTVTDGGRRLVVQRVETDAVVLRLNDLGTSPAGHVPDLPEMDDRERAVVEAAVEGGHETDEVPDWLAKFASRTLFVRADGEYYRLEYALPVYTIAAEAVDEDEVSGEIASNDAYREAVTHDGLRTTGLMRVAREEGYRTLSLWPSLREFVETYDAVEYRGEVLAFEMEVEDPGPPYEVAAEPASLADLARGSVWDANDAPEEIRTILREAGAESGTYSLDEPPSGLLEGLDDHEYVYLDGTFYTAYVENREPHDVSVNAEAVADAGDGSAFGLHLSLHNESDAPIEVMSGAPEPFGVLTCHPADDPETGHLLWTDAYEESDHVHTEGRDVVAVNDIGLLTAVGPGEEVGRTFELPADLPTGEYVLDDGVGVEYADREGGSLSFRVVFQME